MRLLPARRSRSGRWTSVRSLNSRLKPPPWDGELPGQPPAGSQLLHDRTSFSRDLASVRFLAGIACVVFSRRGEREPRRADQRVHDALLSGAISEPQLMHTAPDTRHRARQRHGKRQAGVESCQRMGEVPADLFRE